MSEIGSLFADSEALKPVAYCKGTFKEAWVKQTKTSIHDKRLKLAGLNLLQIIKVQDLNWIYYKNNATIKEIPVFFDKQKQIVKSPKKGFRQNNYRHGWWTLYLM